MKKEKIIIFAFSFICLILLLLFSNKFIMKTLIKEESRLKEQTFNMIDSTQNVLFNVENCEYMGGIYEYFCIEGWAFCEATSDTSNKTIYIILKKEGENKCYYSQGALLPRTDVFYTFENDYNISGTMHGFVSQFASFNVPVGKYNIYLYTKENDHDYGMIDTGYVFYKEKNTSTATLESDSESE